MLLKTKDFLISGFVSQPDEITPVPGDVEVAIHIHHKKLHSFVKNGEFCLLVDEIEISSGDALTFEFRNVNTKETLQLKNDPTDKYTIVLSEQDIIARNVCPEKGQLRIFVSFKDEVHLRSEDMLFRGTVFQPDGKTPIPFGLEIKITNAIKNFIIPITDHGEYFQYITSTFESKNIISYSIYDLDGNLYAIEGNQRALQKTLEDRDIAAIGIYPNRGEVVQSFVLSRLYEGTISAPSVVSTHPKDKEILIKWRSVRNPNSRGFRIYRSLRPFGPFVLISGENPITELEYTDRNLINGVQYFYQIRTVADTESLPSATIGGTPSAVGGHFALRQMINKKFVAGRDVSISFMARKISGSELTVSILYKTTDEIKREDYHPNIPIAKDEHTLFPTSIFYKIPDNAEELLGIQFHFDQASSYEIDDITVGISGDTTDPIARQIISPSFNSKNTKLIVKNKLPGDLIEVDVETGRTVWLEETGDFSSPIINSTEDPAEWSYDDQMITYSYFKSSNTEIRRLNFGKHPATIRDTNNGLFPKFVYEPNSCNSNLYTLVFLADQKLKKIALNGNVSKEITTDTKEIEAFDLDVDGNIVFCNHEGIFVNDLNGGISRQISPEKSEFVQWGCKQCSNQNFILYTKSFYQKHDNKCSSGFCSSSALTDVYATLFTNTEISGETNQYEYEIDTSQFADGPLKIVIRTVPVGDTYVQLTTIINNASITANSSGVVPMKAKCITDPISPSGITNNIPLMSAGLSCANHGVLEFITSDDNQILTTVRDTFTSNPSITIHQTKSGSNCLNTPQPIKLRFTWYADSVKAGVGGEVKNNILTVDVGGIVKNIFIPTIQYASNNPLELYVSEDGSTYFDSYMKILARKAITSSMIIVPPGLGSLPQFTRTSAVSLQWYTNPGSPTDIIRQYILYRSTDNTSYAPIYTTADNSVTQFSDSNIVNGTSYFYKISAVDILGNVVGGTNTVFTVIDKTGALEAVGKIYVDLNVDDSKINEESKLEPGTGKVFDSKTTFSLSQTRNTGSPPITVNSKVYADYTFQKTKDIVFRLQPVDRVNSVVGDVSGVFVFGEDYIFIKDDNVQSGSVLARDKMRFIRQERRIVEETVERGEGPHSADGLANYFPTAIESISLPLRVSGEPMKPIAGFMFQLTNTEPGKLIDGKRQSILEVYAIINTTTGVTYEINDITPNYTVTPALLQLDIFSNTGENPFPSPTDQIEIEYSYIRIFPNSSYMLDKSQNSVVWIGDSALQPQTGQNYLVTYRHLAPIPGERITLNYSTNNIIRILQNGDISTGTKGLDEKRSICADVLARETIPVPIDIEMTVRLYDTADEGFTKNEILSTVSGLFSNKKLGEGIRISDIACAIKSIPEIESIKLDPFDKLGRTDTPTLLRILINDTIHYLVEPGRVEGEVTFYTEQKPTSDIIIPAYTIVSNDFRFSNDIKLFETKNTFTAPISVIDSFYAPAKNRYEFRVQVRALFTGSATINRKVINVVGGILKNSLSVENESIIEGAIEKQEDITGNGTMTLKTKKGQLLEILKVQNYSASTFDPIPLAANFIQLKHKNISNAKGNGIGILGNSSIVIDDTTNFKKQVAGLPAASGEFYVNYKSGYIQTFSKTSTVDLKQQIRYKYLEDYSLDYVKINEDTFSLYAPSNIEKPIPKQGDYILVTYRWKGTGIPLQYRIETFDNSEGIIDFGYIKTNEFSGPIFINNRSERIDNIKNNPIPPFYAYDPGTKQLSIIGRTLEVGDEVIFRFSTPFGDMDLIMTVFDLVVRQNVSRFTFNVDFQTFNMTSVEFLEPGGDSVPTSPGMIINAGLPKTNQRQIVIQFAAVNAKDMVLSTDILFRDKTELDFEPFTTVKLFEIPPGDGVKKIYAKIRFENLGIQDEELNASIEYQSDYNEGTFIPIPSHDFIYSAADGILRLPTSFGQSDIVLNAMQSLAINSVIINIGPLRYRRNLI